MQYVIIIIGRPTKCDCFIVFNCTALLHHSLVKMVLLSFQKFNKRPLPFLEFWKVAVVQKENSLKVKRAVWF